METALLKLPKDGETVLGIFDFEGAGPQNIDLEFAKFLVSLHHYLAAFFLSEGSAEAKRAPHIFRSIFLGLADTTGLGQRASGT